MVPFIPLLLVICGFKLNLLPNLFKTIFGKFTLVGYGGKQDDYIFLPSLKNGIIKYPMSQKVIQYSNNYFKNKNVEYAKSYSLLKDVHVIWSNLYKLGNKV